MVETAEAPSGTSRSLHKRYFVLIWNLAGYRMLTLQCPVCSMNESEGIQYTDTLSAAEEDREAPGRSFLLGLPFYFPNLDQKAKIDVYSNGRRSEPLHLFGLSDLLG